MRESKSVLLKSIRNYRFHSIFLKILTLLLCVNMLPVFGVLAVSYYYYGRVLQSEREAYSREWYVKISKEVDSLFGGLKDKMMIIALDDKTEYFFVQKNPDYISLDKVLEIKQNVSVYNAAVDHLENVYIYSTANQKVIDSVQYCDYDQFDDKVVLDQWSSSNKYFHVTYVNRELNGKQHSNICVYYNAHYSKTNKGILVFLLDIKALAETIDYGENVRLMILNETQVIFDSAGAYDGVPSNLIDDLTGGRNDDIYSGVLQKSGLRIILQIAEPPLSENMEFLKELMLSFCCIMLVATLILVFYISKKIFDPFQEIMSALKADVSQFNENNLLRNVNEVSYIKQSIYATLSSKHDVEVELRKRIHLLKKAQAVALQAQIKPHFINNILENINQKMIMSMGKHNEISQMLSALSSLLNATLCNTDTFITLEEEIEYVQQYVFIQSKLLEDKFDLDIQIPEELEECKLIKLILQPVVENAIKYGIKPYSGRGRLSIWAERQADAVFVKVRDTGFGLTEEDVAEINDSIHKTVIKESDHIGLSNVNQRIILAFGEAYGVTVKSRIGMGTTVEVKIPYQI